MAEAHLLSFLTVPTPCSATEFARSAGATWYGSCFSRRGAEAQRRILDRTTGIEQDRPHPIHPAILSISVPPSSPSPRLCASARVIFSGSSSATMVCRPRPAGRHHQLGMCFRLDRPLADLGTGQRPRTRSPAETLRRRGKPWTGWTGSTGSRLSSPLPAFPFSAPLRLCASRSPPDPSLVLLASHTVDWVAATDLGRCSLASLGRRDRSTHANIRQASGFHARACDICWSIGGSLAQRCFALLNVGFRTLAGTSPNNPGVCIIKNSSAAG